MNCCPKPVRLGSIYPARVYYGNGRYALSKNPFHTVSKNALKWGNSIGNPDSDQFWVGTSPYCETQYGSYREALETKNYETVLNWLADFAQCRRSENTPEFASAFDRIMSYVELAIEHKIASDGTGMELHPNPVAGATELRHANTCYVWNPDGGCVGNLDLATFCLEKGCDPRVFNSSGDVISGEEVPQSGLVPQQIVYETRPGISYDNFHFGLYQYSPSSSRYFLISTQTSGGDVSYPNDNLLHDTFQIHWDRLNRDRNPLNAPSTLWPAFCMTGTSHVLRIEEFKGHDTGLRTWLTFTFHNGHISSNEVPDFWFCN